MPVIPPLGRLRQEDQDFEANLSCLARPSYTQTGKRLQQNFTKGVI
jgi:hypothetical protein